MCSIFCNVDCTLEKLDMITAPTKLKAQLASTYWQLIILCLKHTWASTFTSQIKLFYEPGTRALCML